MGSGGEEAGATDGVTKAGAEVTVADVAVTATVSDTVKGVPLTRRQKGAPQGAGFSGLAARNVARENMVMRVTRRKDLAYILLMSFRGFCS